MEHLGWKSCKADQDVWYKPEVHPDDGCEYMAYALLYSDDALIIHHDALTAIKEINKYFTMKPDSIGDPDFYLGAKLHPITLKNGVVAWGLSSSKYIQSAVANVKEHLAEKGGSLPKRAATPLPAGYCPELDTSPVLEDEQASYYQSQIGILHWCVELGRVDMVTPILLCPMRDIWKLSTMLMPTSRRSTMPVLCLTRCIQTLV